MRNAISIVIFRMNYASHIDWNKGIQSSKKKKFTILGLTWSQTITLMHTLLISSYICWIRYIYIYIFFFFPSLFWPCCVAHRILVPKSGIKPVFPTVEAQSLNHWTTREVLTKPSIVKKKKNTLSAKYNKMSCVCIEILPKEEIHWQSCG